MMDIRRDDVGRYCLNDCHRAAGGEKKHGPSYWAVADQTRGLVDELRGLPEIRYAPLQVLNDGSNNGTYAVKELVYAYAMWISPSFHLAVIRAFDGMVTGTIQAPAQLRLPQTFSEALRALADTPERLEEAPFTFVQRNDIGTVSYRPRASMRLSLLAASSLALSGCATIVNGSNQSVTVSTDPPGASCKLSRQGETMGAVPLTPGSVQVSKSKNDIDVTCEKPGYQTATVSKSPNFGGATFANIIAGGVVGAVVDAASGANYTYPSEVHVSMAPIAPAVATAQQTVPAIIPASANVTAAPLAAGRLSN